VAPFGTIGQDSILVFKNNVSFRVTHGLLAECISDAKNDKLDGLIMQQGGFKALKFSSRHGKF
jgi:hypothetical protein